MNWYLPLYVSALVKTAVSSLNIMPFKTSVAFTAEEIAAHNKHLPLILSTARNYLQNTWSDHVEFHKTHGVSRYYGDRNSTLNEPKERIAALKAAGASAKLVHDLKPISCVGLARDALRAGFLAANDPVLEQAILKIEAYAKANHLDGSAIIDALQRLGWKVLYWNPDPSKNEAWDEEDGLRTSRGWHAERYRTVRSSKTYYFNRVDDSELLVGFGTNVPDAFTQVPFFVGVAHTGYHVFPGFLGRVIEAHSMRALQSKDNIENSPFNPLAKGGAPRWTNSEKYRSGLICVPPGFLPL